jgi:hypothetical protein
VSLCSAEREDCSSDGVPAGEVERAEIFENQWIVDKTEVRCSGALVTLTCQNWVTNLGRVRHKSLWLKYLRVSLWDTIICGDFLALS